MSWSVGPIYLQKEITGIISNFKEVFSLIPTVTSKPSLTYYPLAFSICWKIKISLSYFTNKKTKTQKS